MPNNHHGGPGHGHKNISKPDADQKSMMGVEKIIRPNAQAQHAAAEEKTMSLREALSLCPKAIGWSVVLSSTLIMDGYDLAILSSLFASPQFNKKFGVRNDSTGKYAIPAPWQSALSNGARAGEVIGLLINGIASDRFGYRKTMIASLTAMVAFIFVVFFAPNVQILVLGEILCGMPWGVSSFDTQSFPFQGQICPIFSLSIKTSHDEGYGSDYGYFVAHISPCLHEATSSVL
jgi:MFS transporter, SP family, general alpha glucoside:H+ symporter